MKQEIEMSVCRCCLLLLPVISFRQYIEKVVSDPLRREEIEDLVKLLGMAKIERVLQGKLTMTPKDFV